jgi:hypothetical protein
LAEENNLGINIGKTEMLNLVKDGKVKHGDIVYGQERLRVMKCYEYHTITQQTSEKAFTVFSNEKTMFVMRVMADIQSLRKLIVGNSIGTLLFKNNANFNMWPVNAVETFRKNSLKR